MFTDCQTWLVLERYCHRLLNDSCTLTVCVGAFSTLLTVGEEDNTAFMAVCAETMRRPSSWHLRVLHMALICGGMSFRIGSKTANIEKHLLPRRNKRVCALCVCFPHRFVHVEVVGCDFVFGVTRRLAAHDHYDKVTNVGWLFLTERMRDERHHPTCK